MQRLYAVLFLMLAACGVQSQDRRSHASASDDADLELTQQKGAQCKEPSPLLPQCANIGDSTKKVFKSNLSIPVFNTGTSTTVTIEQVKSAVAMYKCDAPAGQPICLGGKANFDGTLVCRLSIKLTVTAEAQFLLGIGDAGISVGAGNTLTREFTVDSVARRAPIGTPLTVESCFTGPEMILAWSGLQKSIDDINSGLRAWPRAGCTSDRQCEDIRLLPSIDDWTNSRCVYDSATRTNRCKEFGIRNADCPGPGSSGQFEYPCDRGLSCTLVQRASLFGSRFNRYECR